MNATRILDKMQLPNDIRRHPNVVLAEEQADQDWWIIVLLQGFYLLGVGATGYATCDLFVKAGFPLLGGIAAAVVIDAFGIVSAYLSTRARLRNQTDLVTRSIVWLGAAASAAINYLFHDEPLLRIGLPILVALSMVCWVKSVADKYAAIFLVQKMIAQRDRQQRRRERRAWIAYVAAVLPWRAVKTWRTQTAELGVTEREVGHEVALAKLEAERTIGASEAAAAIERAADANRRGPFPPRNDAPRPISGAPLNVEGDDELAAYLKSIGANKTEIVRQLHTDWWTNYEANGTALFDIPFHVLTSSVNLIRLLAPYNIHFGSPGNVSNIRGALVREGRFPSKDEYGDVHVVLEGTVVTDAITAA